MQNYRIGPGLDGPALAIFFSLFSMASTPPLYSGREIPCPSKYVEIDYRAIRNRRAKPDLWKLSDVERLATHFALPATACIQLNKTFRDLPAQLRITPNDERRRTERLLLIKTTQLELYNQSDWPVRQLLMMHRALH